MIIDRNKRICLKLIIIIASIYTMSKKVKKHEIEINNIKSTIEELKSKGA